MTTIEIESGSESESEIEIESESESEIETQICCIQLSIINRKFLFPAYSYLSVFKSVFYKVSSISSVMTVILSY